MLHPYASLRLSPRSSVWVLAGYGWGDVEIEERDRVGDREGPPRRVETDATLWMVSAGVEGSVPLRGLGEGSELAVRVLGTRTGGELRGARFDDEARSRLRGTRSRTWRVAGELEASHRIAFGAGAAFRPFVTARLRGDAGDDLGDDWEVGVDLGGGAELIWPDRGLSLGVRGTAQLNRGAGRREHQVAVDLSYDLAGDRRGVTVALESALAGSGSFGGLRRSRVSAVSADAGRAPGDLGGQALGALLPGTEGVAAAREDADFLRPSLRGEIGYGLVAAPWAGFAGRGLLTPYARFDVASGGQLYATGLRFDSFAGPRLGLEAGLDRAAADGAGGAARSPNYQFLFTGEWKF